jgi:hypothetical protein
MTVRRFAWWLVFGGLAACGNDFAPASRLTSLRVIGLRSEPVAPAPGEVSTLSAFVYTSPGSPAPTYAWSWCPFASATADGAECLVTEAELTELTGQTDLPPYDLGSGETATFAHVIRPEVLAALCGGVPGQPALVDCKRGFPAEIKLVVRQGEEEVTAVRRLRLRFSEAHEPNANPTIDGLVAEVGGVAQPLGASPGPVLTRREEFVVRTDVPASSLETFQGEDDDGRPAPQEERVSVSWFVETGDVEREITSYTGGPAPLADTLENRWTPDGSDDYAPDTAELFVVVRDDRDGVAWRRGTVTLSATP